MEKLGYNTKFFAAEGCKRCAYTGYKGRIGVYEILNLDGDIKDLIAANSSHSEIISDARNKGFRNLFEDALSLISEGITDVQEVSRVIDINAEKNKVLEIFEKLPQEKPSKLIKPPEKKTVPQIETEQPSSPDILKKLLIVEDDAIIRKIIRKTFEKKTGWQISETGDGKIALKTLETEFPDVIILDVM
ncbi:MAG: response regulator, partial [Calditrichales bacterium]|nr:response regulator [Calditrichales bacterium]